jgi:hypothetical protein
MRQFMISLIVEREEQLEDGSTFPYAQMVECDLMQDNIAAFIAELPQQLVGKSSVWMAITNDDGETATYVDGYSPEFPYSGHGERKWHPIEAGEREALRNQARQFAESRYAQLHGEVSTENNGPPYFEPL